MTAKQRAKKAATDILICLTPTSSEYGRIYEILLANLREAMRDQRHACAEAIAAIIHPDNLTPDERYFLNKAHQVAMNAEIKE